MEKKYRDKIRMEAERILERYDDITIVKKFREQDRKYKDVIMNPEQSKGMTLDYYITREAFRMAAHERGYTDDVLEEKRTKK